MTNLGGGGMSPNEGNAGGNSYGGGGGRVGGNSNMTTRYEQAMARIEEEIARWGRDVSFDDIIPDSKDIQLAKTQLSAWETLKDVLEIHGQKHPTSYTETGGICNECLSDNPCPTAEKIIEGVGIAQ